MRRAARAELLAASASYLSIIGGGGDADGDGTPDLVTRQLAAGDRGDPLELMVVPVPEPGVHDVETAAAAR